MKLKSNIRLFVTCDSGAGAGKTTATGKLGLYLKEKDKKFFSWLQIFIDQQL